MSNYELSDISDNPLFTKIKDSLCYKCQHLKDYYFLWCTIKGKAIWKGYKKCKEFTKIV
jgi:hypothetical protein